MTAPDDLVSRLNATLPTLGSDRIWHEAAAALVQLRDHNAQMASDVKGWTKALEKEQT